MRIVIDTDSKELYKEDCGCLVPFTALAESEQNEVSNALFDMVARHNLCGHSESVEDMIKNQHRLIKSHLGVLDETDTEDENTYKFCTTFNDTLSIGAISATIMSTRITTSIVQSTYKDFRV